MSRHEQDAVSLMGGLLLVLVGLVVLLQDVTTLRVDAGVVAPLVLVAVGIPDASAADRHVDGVPAPKQSIITPAIIVLTIFFMLLGLSNAGISNFGVVALISGYGASFASANLALTAFLACSAIGVLAGGYLADRTSRHGQLAAACFAVNAVIMLVIATTTLPSRRA